jgi:DMSO/TMAO reductase YedYZ molybdopterin-dependent catalytic subunit
LFTPISELYVTDTTAMAPRLAPDRWQLTVDGLVEHRQRLSLDDLRRLGEEDLDAVLCCIHNRLRSDWVGNVRWTGTPIDRVLAAAAPSRHATHAIWHSADGWSGAVPLDLVARNGGLIATAANGDPLTPSHGAPARAFVPGLYGQFAGAKWLTRVELVSASADHHWSRRGWPSDPVPVRPQARIDHPAHRTATPPDIEITGVAWAPTSGVASVEISVDNGPWVPAELAAEIAPTAWRRFRHRLALEPGPHRIAARAVRRDGAVQDDEPRPSFPTGVSGYHTIAVTTERHRRALRPTAAARGNAPRARQRP